MKSKLGLIKLNKIRYLVLAASVCVSATAPAFALTKAECEAVLDNAVASNDQKIYCQGFVDRCVAKARIVGGSAGLLSNTQIATIWSGLPLSTTNGYNLVLLSAKNGEVIDFTQRKNFAP